MVTVQDFGEYETAWCPGCGNFPILKALKDALVKCVLAPRQILLVSGIGQAAKAPHYLNANVFNGLHGRSLPVATGAKLANPELTVIAESGDGCMYGEGGNHFLAAIRRNVNITVLVHNNMVYGLTKGQASPTSERGFVTKAQPHGANSEPFNPVAVAVAMGAGFVARAYAAQKEHLADTICAAIQHRGLSLVDILQPCVSFNKVNTYEWYQKRCYVLDGEHDPGDWDKSIKLAREFGERIPLGIIYKQDRPVFEDGYPVLKDGPLCQKEVDVNAFKGVMETFM